MERASLHRRFSFLNDQGAKYAIEWVIKYGNDITRLNPLGSSSLYAKKCYHTDQAARRDCQRGWSRSTDGHAADRPGNNVVKVLIDGQAAVVGTMSPMGQLIGFEIDVVKAANGTLFFTDFKIAR